MRLVSSTSSSCAREVVRRVVQANLAVRFDRDPVLEPRQIFGHRQPVDAPRDPRFVRPHRHLRHHGLRHHAVRAALRLDLAERKLARSALQIEIVDRHRLLKHRVVHSKRMKPLHHRRQVRHVALADEARRIRQAVRDACRSPIAAAAPPNSRRRTTRSRAAPRPSRSSPPRSISTASIFLPLASVIKLARDRVGPQRDVRALRRRPDARRRRRRSSRESCTGTNCRCCRRCSSRAGRAAAATDAGPAPSAARRSSPTTRECGTGGNGYGPRGPSVGSTPCFAVHFVHRFGAIVVRRERVVIDRPRRRDAVDVLDGLEVFRPQPVHHRAPELGVAADAVVRVRPERLAGSRRATSRWCGSADPSRPTPDSSCDLPAG